MLRSLPVLSDSTTTVSRAPAELLSELQALGMRWLAREGPGLSRAGGAGPSDHKAITWGDQTVMVPILTHAASSSPFWAEPFGSGTEARLYRAGELLGSFRVPRTPRFYERSTRDGIPYWKIATLHGTDVLATTVLQTCTRYGHRETSCQFCAIGQSLAGRMTVAEKTPEQLGEVARAAVDLDGVRHMVMTTGTPATSDRGAQKLAEAARGVRARVELPLQAQCEPPQDHAWFGRLRDAGVDALGMHLEAVTDRVRRRIMPGKAEVPVAHYLEAFAVSVEVFGRGQVSTYILAGLGDSEDEIAELCEELVALGVYPFVVPFVPIRGTPLEHAPPPEPAFLESILQRVARSIARGGLRRDEIKAGCGRCGACSSLAAREREVREEVFHA